MATFLLEALGNNWGLPREYSGKESICQCKRCKRCRLNWPLCWEDSLKEGMATHSRILIWEIPWTQNTGMLQSMGSKRVGHKWVTEHTNTHIHAEELFSCLFQVLEDTWNSWLVTLFYFKVYHSSSLSVVYPLTLCLPFQLFKNSDDYTDLLIASKIFFLSHYPWPQFSSVAQSCPTLWDPMDCSVPGLPVHHWLLEFFQTHVHGVGDAIQPSHPLLSSSPPAFNLSQHQGLFKWVSSLHQVAKVLELHLQHQSFQWIFRTDCL